MNEYSDEIHNNKLCIQNYLGLSVSQYVWAERRGDWFYVQIKEIRLPMPNTPRFTVARSDGSNFLANNILDVKAFWDKNPFISDFWG